MKLMPRIDKFMTPMPHTVGQDIPLRKAIDLMREYRIRHLPVQHGGRLVGILSERDAKFVESCAAGKPVAVEDAMTADPYVVHPDTALDVVLAEMTAHRYGSAIVAQDNGKVVGIFTAVDALRVLHDQLRANYRASA